jgi:hypothetical protein
LRKEGKLFAALKEVGAIGLLEREIGGTSSAASQLSLSFK